MTATYETQVPLKVYLHWSAGAYTTVFPDYHTNIKARRSLIKPWTRVAEVVRVHPYDRRLYHHTAYRNKDAVAISCCGAGNGYPILPQQIEVMCAEAARVCKQYNIPVDDQHIFTHGRAARIDNYFPERVDFDGKDEEFMGKIRYYLNRLHKGLPV